MSEQASKIISAKWVFSDDEIKEVNTMKAMELQADPKNRQGYKRLLEYYNVNLKFNDDIYEYYESAIRKSQSIISNFQKLTSNLMIQKSR